MTTTRDNIDAVMHRRGVSPDTWIAPTLAGNWVYYGAPFNQPGYYKDVTNRVWLRGLLGVSPTIGTSTQAPPSTITTLPAGYVPVATCYLIAWGAVSASVNSPVLISVTNTGVVSFAAQVSGTSVVDLSLDGLSFSVN